jgi:PAS domain S-box-containing protein
MTGAKAPSPLRQLWAAGVTLLVGLAATLAGWSVSSANIRALSHERFTTRVDEINVLIDSRLVAYAQVLRGFQAVVAASGHPSREDWARFNRTLQVETIYPGLTGTVYIRAVPDEQRGEVETEVRGFEPGFAIRPPGQRPFYTVVTSVEPRSPGNLPVIGSDSWAHPERRRTLESARDSGDTRITGKLTLVIDDKPTPAFLMYQAIYRDSAIPDGVEQRASRLMGFAAAGCRVGVLMQAILAGELRDVALAVHDGEGSAPDSLYFTSHPDFDFATARHQDRRELSIGGRTLSVRYAALPGFTLAAERESSLQYLFGGLAVTLLLTVIVWSQASMRMRAVSMADRMTRSLRESERRFREMAENIDQVFFVADRDYQRFHYISPAFDRIWGYPANLLMADAGAWATWLHPEDRHRIGEFLATNKDAEQYSAEFRVVRPDGSICWVAAHAFNVPASEGEAARVVGFHADVTEHKRSESRAAAHVSEIERSNAELEQFAYVASHDLREPLRMISSYIALLERRYQHLLDDSGREFLGFAREGAARMDRLVLDLLEFSRVGRANVPMVPMSVGEALDAALRHLAPAIAEAAGEVEIDTSTLPMVLGDAGQITSLFQNLIGNAVKYRAPERPLSIEIACRLDGGLWEFTISDNGIGIDECYFAQIFRIFQRLHTRDSYDGTGIGLAICKRIVERHGGRIWLESVPGEGTTFHVTLQQVADPGEGI